MTPEDELKNLEVATENPNLGGAERPPTLEEYENQVQTLRAELDAKADAVKKETEQNTEQALGHNADPEKLVIVQEFGNKANTESSAVVSEFGYKIVAIDSTESQPAMPETVSFTKIAETPQNVDATKEAFNAYDQSQNNPNYTEETLKAAVEQGKAVLDNASQVSAETITTTFSGFQPELSPQPEIKQEAPVEMPKPAEDLEVIDDTKESDVQVDLNPTLNEAEKQRIIDETKARGMAFEKNRAEAKVETENPKPEAEKPLIDPSISSPTAQSENPTFPSPEFDEAQKSRQPKITRVESVAQKAVVENLKNVVDDRKEEENRQAPEELTKAVEDFNNRPLEAKPKTESHKPFFDRVGEAIGKISTKYAVDAVPLSAVETQKDHAQRIAHERHIADYNVMEAPRDRVYLRPVQKFLDRFNVHQAEKRVGETSVTLASLTKRLENDTARVLEIEGELKEASEKINKLSSDPINLKPEEVLKKQREFDAYKANLVAEQSRLKNSIETATADHKWVKGQMESFETYRGKIVENITRRNELRLAPLNEQSELVKNEINNFRAQIDDFRGYISRLSAERRELANDLDKKALAMYDTKIKRANDSIEDLKKQLSKRVISAGDLGEKIQRIQAECDKFKRVTEQKPSDRHENLDSEKPLPEAPPPVSSSESRAENRGPSFESESTDDESESNVEVPEIEKKQESTFRTTPNPNPGHEEIAESLKKDGVQELFPETTKAQAKPEVQPAPTEVTPKIPPNLEVAPIPIAQKMQENIKNIVTKKSLKEQAQESREKMDSNIDKAKKSFERLKKKAQKVGFSFTAETLNSESNKNLYMQYKKFRKMEIKTPKQASELSSITRQIAKRLKVFIAEKSKI